LKVLLIGNGAREHALAEAITRGEAKLVSLMAANNPGISSLSSNRFIGRIDEQDLIRHIVEKTKPDIAVIGPEAPLQTGVVDFLSELKVPSVGPVKELAKLETSKSFSRRLQQQYNIKGMPRWQAFESMHEIDSYMEELKDFVIKPDGLTGGKGVKVKGEHFKSISQGVEYCREVLDKHPSVIVEERLEGEEFSLQCLTDGRHVIATPPVQDHKRAFEDDTGPNTGGMGSYSCEDHLLPFLKQEHIDEALEITKGMAKAIHKETGIYYKGVMYGGFILTRDGVKLIEYNARFGDPEAMNVLPLMETSFVDVCRAIVEGSLNTFKTKFSKKATVCKYVVPKGYPEKPVKDVKIDIGKNKARAYYASIDKREDGLYMLGSRAVAFVGISDTIDEAERIAQQGVESVKGPVFYRKDIGTKALLKKRVEHVRSLIP